MRIFSKIISSLIIAGSLCLVLWYMGLLKFNQQPDKTVTRKSKTPKVHSAISTEPDVLENQFSGTRMQTTTKLKETTETSTEEELVLEKSKSGLSAKKGDGKISNPKLPDTIAVNEAPEEKKETNHGMNLKYSYLSIDSEVFEQTLSYLHFLEKDKDGNTELRFSQFLKSEFDLSDKESDHMLQMTFWKNFLVFQKKWHAEEAGALQKAFDLELALKKAGFKANDIPLGEDEINAAEAQLALVQQNFALSVEKPAASLGESP